MTVLFMFECARPSWWPHSCTATRSSCGFEVTSVGDRMMSPSTSRGTPFCVPYQSQVRPAVEPVSAPQPTTFWLSGWLFGRVSGATVVVPW